MNKLMKFGLAAVTVATAGILTISSISYAQDTVQSDGDAAGAPGLIERGQRFFQLIRMLLFDGSKIVSEHFAATMRSQSR